VTGGHAFAAASRYAHCADVAHGTLTAPMSPTWIWIQAAIVVFVVIGMIVAVTKLV
jgi:hypothetical protein